MTARESDVKMAISIMRIGWWAVGSFVLGVMSCDDADRNAVGGTTAGPVTAQQASSSSGSQGGEGQGGAAQGGGGGQVACTGLGDAGCYNCCAGEQPAGEATLQNAFTACGCANCGRDCAPSLCGAGDPPDDLCAGCAKTTISMSGDCGADAGFQSACLNDGGCAAFVACFNACAP